MADIQTFEGQVWKKEKVRIVIRSTGLNLELVGYTPKAVLPDGMTVRQFRRAMAQYLGGDLPFVIIGGNGLKPGATITLGEIRVSYGATPKKPKIKSIGKVEGEPIARAMLDRLGSPDKAKKLGRSNKTSAIPLR